MLIGLLVLACWLIAVGILGYQFLILLRDGEWPAILVKDFLPYSAATEVSEEAPAFFDALFMWATTQRASVAFVAIGVALGLIWMAKDFRRA